MPPKRPKELKFTGDRYDDGRPVYFLDFVPDRDLDEAETDALTNEQLADIRASGLYREVHESAPKKSAAKKSATSKVASAKAEVAEPVPEPEAAAEPATESEG
jgi:hypothetical protein